jgi:hypothetical protein
MGDDYADQRPAQIKEKDEFPFRLLCLGDE